MMVRVVLIAVVIAVPILAALGAFDMQEQSMLDQSLRLPVYAVGDPIAPTVAAEALPPAAPTLAPTEGMVATVGVSPDRGIALQITPTVPPPPLLVIPHYDEWVALARCESGGDWSIDTGNGYYGGLQFSLTSWRGAGGQQYASYPHQASAAQQMLTAETLLDMQGWGAWPSCSRQVGLR